MAFSLDACKQLSQKTCKAAPMVFLGMEASLKNEKAEKEKTLPMQYKFSIPKEKVKREMKFFNGI